MVIAIGLLLTVVLIAAGTVVVVGLRRWMQEEIRVEAVLREPDAHPLVYAVPDGQDPTILVSALRRAGFTAMGDMEGGVERLLVACPDEEDRDRVRSTIEHVTSTGFDGVEMHVGPVRFQDER